MSNPFDQFAVDLQAALPPGAAPPAPAAAPAYDPNASLMAQPPAAAAARQPVMNSPVMNSPNGYGGPPQQGGYGQQPQYGMPPQQQPPMQQSMGGMNMSMSSGMMAPPPAGPPAAGSFGGYDPNQSQSTMGMAGGYGAPAPPSDPGFGAGPPSGHFSAPPAGGPPADNSNPFGSPGMAPPAGDSANPFGAPPGAPPAADPSYGFGAPPAAPPAADNSNPFGAPPGGQPGYGAPPGGQPGFGAPPAPPQDYGMPPQQQSGYGAPPGGPPGGDQYADPWGAPGGGAPAPPADPNMGALALVPAQQQSNPYAAYGAPPPPQQPPAPANDPYGAPVGNPYGAPQAQQPPPNDPYGAPGANPYGAPPQQPPANDPYGAPPANPYGAPPAHDPYGAQANPYGAPPQQQSQALTPYGGPAAADPFSVFEQSSAPPPAPPAPAPVAPQQQQALVPANPAASADSLWGDLGFDAPPTADPPAPAAPAPAIEANPTPGHTEEKKTSDGNLPPGGEYYDARIFTPTLGVMFFKPQELTDSLFLNTDQGIVDGLAERPVVAFIVEGSSARAAGVELGHVLLKVNGVDVRNPKEASRLIKEGPRPLPLLFYVPNTDVVVAEGEHMVKYDTRETTAPNSAKDWKPKYVVIGGIIAQPWMMNMYRSKSEYDIAVIETQARRPVSVKVKQFSLQGARIQNDWQGPQMVKYKNKIHPWKYIVILPVARNPIKISSPNLAQLKPVHEGIRRVLLAQNRDRSYNSQQAPVRQHQHRDQYGHNGHDGYHGGHHQQQQQQQMTQYQGHQQQQQYNY
ncbi:PDZ [Seminavis robusta]|uniref:PDZ n=1 Tax=Seminavis robusta TaxID=568900 RepID=A0A9N8D8Y6_9STRA|nr:PDZ [Seminavis robusta]|eukprot:Sro1_g000780.1 PDZ (795) ;mRNA; r:213427-215884